MFIYGTHHLGPVRAAPGLLCRRGWVGVVCWVKCDQKKKRLSYQLFCNKSCKQGSDCPVPRAGAATPPWNCQGTAVRNTLARGMSSAEAPHGCWVSGPCAFTPSLELLLVAARTTLLRRTMPQWTHTGGKNYIRLHTQPSL